MARYLGIGRKLPTGFDLWKEIVLNNNEKSLAKMVRYCRHDVVLLEEVWDKMNPYVPARTKVGSGGFTVGEDQRQLNTKLPRVERLQSDLGRECPECGAPNCYSCGSYTTTAGYNRTSLKCKCGKRWTTATSKIKPLPHKHPSVCPYCSSTRTIIRGSARTLKTTGEYKIRKYCKDCRRGFSIAASRILDE